MKDIPATVLLKPSLPKNDRTAYCIISIFSVVIFGAIVALGRYKYEVSLDFDVHIFAAINAVINSIVAGLLITAIVMVKKRRYLLHKRLMFSALIMSVLFLLFYIAHHLLAAETKFGGTGALRLIYFIILISHIFLAAIILPFILYTTYRALTGEYEAHKKIARYTWPFWLYVAVTGPIVYLMISPYY